MPPASASSRPWCSSAGRARPKRRASAGKKTYRSTCAPDQALNRLSFFRAPPSSLSLRLLFALITVCRSSSAGKEAPPRKSLLECASTPMITSTVSHNAVNSAVPSQHAASSAAGTQQWLRAGLAAHQQQVGLVQRPDAGGVIHDDRARLRAQHHVQVLHVPQRAVALSRARTPASQRDCEHLLPALGPMRLSHTVRLHRMQVQHPHELRLSHLQHPCTSLPDPTVGVCKPRMAVPGASLPALRTAEVVRKRVPGR